MTFRIFILFGLLVAAGCKNEPPSDMTDPGQLLYSGYTKKDVNCARCHGPEGQGGMQAPDIRNVFDKFTEDEIADMIDEGKGQGEKAMPPFENKLSEAEVQLLIDFLRKL